MARTIQGKANLKAHIDLLAGKDILAPKSVQLSKGSIYYMNVLTLDSSNVGATWRYLVAESKAGRSRTFVLKTISIIKGALRLNRVTVHRSDDLEIPEFELQTMKSKSILEYGEDNMRMLQELIEEDGDYGPSGRQYLIQNEWIYVHLGTRPKVLFSIENKSMVQTGNPTPNIVDITFLILKILGIFASLIVATIFIIPRVLHVERLWKSKGSVEGITTASFFAAAGIAAAVGLSPIVGAFAVGMAVASTHVISKWRAMYLNWR